MYQFYYAVGEPPPAPDYRRRVSDVFTVTAIRPAMWEEHCLECAAPRCFQSCAYYAPRSDGRCKRFADGVAVSPHPDGVCGEGAYVRFRPWSNLMTVVFPATLPPAAYAAMTAKNRRLGGRLARVLRSRLPTAAKWQLVRTREYIRRRALRRLSGGDNTPDAFILHGWSYESEPFRLIVELYDGDTPFHRAALTLTPGENLLVLGPDALAATHAKAGSLVKLYPENDREAALHLLWCDFVRGAPAGQTIPAGTANPAGQVAPADKTAPAAAPAPTVKCVVWDLDNTLWDGVLIETDDPASLTLRPGAADVMRALDERGILQSCASKNDREAAWPVLERLGVADYLLCPQIHWDAKSASVRAIAERLNIGLDTLALIDDAAFERAQVSAACPEVRVYDAAELPGLLDRPEFRVPATDESRSRRALYRAEERREAAREADGGDTEAFVRSCHIRVRLFAPETDGQRLRCYELLTRTNQLNMSGVRYAPDAFDAALHRPGHTAFAFSCEDDFGAYGVVGFGQYRRDGDTLVFTEFAMSCRAAGRYIESAVFAALLRREGAARGSVTVVKTKKNALLRRTLSFIGFNTVRETADAAEYAFGPELRGASLAEVSG